MACISTMQEGYQGYISHANEMSGDSRTVVMLLDHMSYKHVPWPWASRSNYSCIDLLPYFGHGQHTSRKKAQAALKAALDTHLYTSPPFTPPPFTPNPSTLTLHPPCPERHLHDGLSGACPLCHAPPTPRAAPPSLVAPAGAVLAPPDGAGGGREGHGGGMAWGACS